MTRSVVPVVLLGLVLAACGSPAAPISAAPPSQPSSPIATPPSSETPSAEPLAPSTSAPSEPPVDSVPIPPDSYARVVTDDLRVRSKPGVSEDSKKLEPLLDRDALLVVLDGPVQASGYDWYQVQPTSYFEQDLSYQAGWVAAADKNGEPWIEPEDVACPAAPTTLAELADIFETDQLYFEITCFSGVPLTFTSRLTTPSEWCGLGAEIVVEPLWIDDCGTAPNYLVDVEDDGYEWSLHPAWSPEVDLSIAPPAESPPEDWPRVEVTGQFDHPAARTCIPWNVNGPDSQEPVVLGCRLRFAVTSMREVEG
jgi:hypothetical protein